MSLSETSNATALSYCELLASSSSSDSTPSFLKFVGVALATLATLVSTLALLVIKLSTIKEKDVPLCPFRCCGGSGSCTRTSWKWRLVTAYVGNGVSEALLSTVALSLAPLSVISPVGGTALIFSALLARSGWMPGIKEYLSLAEWLALIATVGALFMTSLFGPKTEFQPPYAEWQRELSRPAVILHFAITVSLMGAWLAVLKLPILRRCRPPPTGLTMTIVSALVSGGAGAYSQLCVKTVMTALRLVVSGDTSPAGMWMTWASIALLAACLPTQLFMMMKSLSAGKASFALPIYFCCIINLTILLDGVFFRIFECMEEASLIVFCLSRRRSPMIVG